MSFRLKDRLQEKILEWRPRTEKLLKDYGHVVIDQVTIGQVIGGMRGVKVLLTDISYLDPSLKGNQVPRPHSARSI